MGKSTMWRSVFILLIVCMVEIHAMKESTLKMMEVLHKSCVTESGVKEKAIKDCRRGIFAEDPALKCYMKCLLVKISGLDDDGNIDEDYVISMVPEEFREAAAGMIKACKTVKGKDLCETAFLTNKCYYNHDKESYYLI